MPREMKERIKKKKYLRGCGKCGWRTGESSFGRRENERLRSLKPLKMFESSVTFHDGMQFPMNCPSFDADMTMMMKRP